MTPRLPLGIFRGAKSRRHVARAHEAPKHRLDVLECAGVVDHECELLWRGRLEGARHERGKPQQRPVDDPVALFGFELLFVGAALQPRHGHVEGGVLRGNGGKQPREEVAGVEALRGRHADDGLNELAQAPVQIGVIDLDHVLRVRVGEVLGWEARGANGARRRAHPAVVVEQRTAFGPRRHDKRK